MPATSRSGLSRRGLLALWLPVAFAVTPIGDTIAKGKKKKQSKHRKCRGLKTAIQVVSGLTAAGIPIGESINYTAETDPNEMLGRPGGYTSKVNFRDTRLTPERDTIETTDGGSVEFFASKTDLQRRVDHLKSVWDTIPLIDRDVVFTKGTVLLRVSIRLLTEQSNAYGSAFRGLNICS